jgi:hypothetical protein
VVELVCEQPTVRVKMIEHEGHVLLESHGDADAETNVEEVNTMISICLPLVYDMGDIIDIEDQVVVVGDGAGDLCDVQLLEGVAMGAWLVMAIIRVKQCSDDDVGGIGPRGDDADPNTLYECATSVDKGVVGTAAQQQLDENVVAFV